ncbi:MAG: CDC48 family AAA ATPase [Candidatus Lokiarchaeota archaeon]|nr:CDC48 family AAA ATPase [Candidatus Lokiarchaeota archaeon]
MPNSKKKNNENKELKLTVQEARKRDIGRSIIRLDAETMNDLGVSTGDIIEIIGNGSSAAIAWPSYPQDQGLGIARIDARLRKNVDVGIDETIVIKKAESQIAKKVALTPYQVKIKTNSRFESFVKRKLLSYPVTKDDLIYLSIGISREIIFKVSSLRPKGICVIRQSTELSISESLKDEPPQGIPYITYENIGGLDHEIQKIREMVELPLKHPELFQRLGIEPPKGVLLRGPPGCGKTLLAKAVANESKAHFISINGPEIMSKFYGESEKKLRSKFKEAEEKAPTIIFIDEIDAIAPKRENVTGEVERRVVAQLLGLMDGLETRGDVVIIGATNRPNAVDPALRRPGRFDREIEIKVPNQQGRLEIMQIHTRNMPIENADKILKEFSKATHGYVGADIASLCRESAMVALRRYLPQLNLDDEEISFEDLQKLEITRKDFIQAKKEIVPSGIREVFIEIPDVHWDDVGGLDSVKQDLKQAVEWPIKSPEAFKRMGVAPRRGVLLYGPPGCGKTLLARAVATESEANFISIKGPEVLSKWVGESEKAIREIFRKAKMASPCIIFIDEIDSIASSRLEGAQDSSGVTKRVLSQLLTELDGLEGTSDIVFIAATNAPNLIDLALMRPGRLDRFCYVPAPNEKDKMEIFKIFTKDMPLSKDVDLKELIKFSDNYSGADIESLCREAAFEALWRTNMKAKVVKIKDFMIAKDKIRPTCTQDIIKFYEEFEKQVYQRKKEQLGMFS